MKVTIKIPEELYRKVKAKSALNGLTVREVTTKLYGKWVEGKMASLTLEGEEEEPSAESWLEEWIHLGSVACKHLPKGPSAREILQEDRNTYH